MAIRHIVLLGDPVLRERAREVERFDEELQALVADMFDTMVEAEGAGLAAPQIGVSLRLFVVDAPEEEGGRRRRLALVNPVVEPDGSEEDRDMEGCLSIPGVSELVRRPARVTFRGFDPEGNPVEGSGTGLFARALQHELDHLNGVLFVDHLSALKRRMLLKKYRKLQEEEQG